MWVVPKDIFGLLIKKTVVIKMRVHFLRPLKLKFQKSSAKILDSSISNVGHYAKVHLITWDIWREKQFLYANSNLEIFSWEIHPCDDAS